MSTANEQAFPTPESDHSHYVPRLTKLEYFAGRNWSQYEIDSMTGRSIESAAMFIGVKESEYNPNIHYRVAVSKARVLLAQALIAELEKVSP